MLYGMKIGLTIEEAADYSGIGRDTLKKSIDRGKLPSLRIGRKTIIRTDTLNRFMEANQGVDLMDIEQVRSVE